MRRARWLAAVAVVVACVTPPGWASTTTPPPRLFTAAEVQAAFGLAGISPTYGMASLGPGGTDGEGFVSLPANGAPRGYEIEVLVLRRVSDAASFVPIAAADRRNTVRRVKNVVVVLEPWPRKTRRPRIAMPARVSLALRLLSRR